MKAPKTITHERRLVDVAEPLATFLGECGALGDRLGPLLIQLPPSLKFDPEPVERFLSVWREATTAASVLEPRHDSWFLPQADALLDALRVARVAADPAVIPDAASPGGWPGLTYRRLRGSQTIYKTSYDDGRLEALASQMAEEQSPEAWVIFDNTQRSAATTDALKLMASNSPAPAR